MPEKVCPICESPNHQSFWYWEKEDKLMRAWAMDARIHFSICRDCSMIFQNPAIESDAASSNDFFNDDFSFGGENQTLSQEPIEWMRQITGYGREPMKALEVYSETKRFDPYLAEQGWDYKAVRASAWMQAGETASEDSFAMPSSAEAEIEKEEQFDIIFCFDALEKTKFPLDLLKKINSCLKPKGVVFIETENPLVAPRVKKICLTSEDYGIIPHHTLNFALFKAGFVNKYAEICRKTRFLSEKMETIEEADPAKLIPTELWGQISYRFQRNYYWAWTANFLETYQKQLEVEQDFLEKTRTYLRQRTLDLYLIRDICGACLLFAEEIANLNKTLDKDWHVTMARIFDVFKNDYALFDILQCGGLKNTGTFSDIERFYFNEKMIYWATPEYFQKHFTQQEAQALCQTIISASQTVCGHLSSFL